MTGPAWYDDEAPDAAQDQAGAVAALRQCLHDDEALSRILPPQPLIEGWLALDTLAWLFGERGSCKTFVAHDMAACVANGVEWHGHAVKQVPVLYCALEGAAGLHVRSRNWCAFNGMDSTRVSFLIPRPPLQVVHHAANLAGLAEETGAGLVIIDTQNRAILGMDENSNVDMGRLIAALDAIRDRTHACVLIIHHAAVGTQRPRGHSSMDGAATTMIRVAKDGRFVKVENVKQREGEPTRSALLELANHDLGAVLTLASATTPTDSGRRVLACLRDLEEVKGRVTYTDLKRSCGSTGMPDSTFNWALRRLVEFGQVTKSNSAYATIPQGQAMLDDRL